MIDIDTLEQKCKHPIILLTYGGSLAYGTNVATSDVDLRGICLHTPRELIGLQNFEQYTPSEDDITIYGVNKIVSLLLNTNPNTIEILGCKPEHYFVLTEEGKLLKDNIDVLLSKRCISSFGGYAIAQLRRLQNALARDSYPQPEKEKHILQSIHNAEEHLRSYYPYAEEEIRLYIDVSEKEDYETEIFMDFNLKHVPLRDIKDIWNEMHQVVKNYDKLNTRNKKKDEASLYKHAMHLVRLYLMLRDILTGKGVITYRPDREFLLDIRNGKYTYQQIFDMVDEYQQELDYLKENTELPANPNYKRAEEIVMELSRRALA
jgi:predicted nucleotidyltransferase